MAARNAFIDMLLPGALQASQMTGVDPRIIIAQAAQETGWGAHAPGNNFFGIKSHGRQGGNTLSTTEYVNGQPVRENASFRAYDSPADSVLGYANFINSNPRYKPFKNAQGLDAQLQALGQSGYATDPNYASSVGAIARSIQLDPSQANFVKNNPQPGGYGPGIEGPNAVPSSFPMGSLAASGIPPEIARYATADENQKSPLASLLEGIGKGIPTPPPPRGGFSGGAANGNALLKAALAGPTIAELFLKKRMGA